MPDLEVIEKRLSAHTEVLSKSEFFTATVELLRDIPFKRIRCLALGSPTEEFQALFQLAYLQLIIKEFEILPKCVSLFDPIFTPQDEHLLTTVHHYSVEEHHSPEETSDILYFMPHAPRSVTSQLLLDEKPQWILGNDVRVTMGTLSKLKFLLEYPPLAKLVHMAEKAEKAEKAHNTGEKTQEEFTVVRRRKKRPGKSVYVEPELDYDLVEVYFDQITITRIESPSSAAWASSFSDLAINVIHKSSDVDENSEVVAESLKPEVSSCEKQS